MATGEVALDLTQYVRVNIGLNPLILQAHRDSVRIVFSESKPAKANTAFHLLSGDDDVPYPIPNIDTNVWALALTDKSSLIVTEIDKLTEYTSDPIFEISKGNVPGHSIYTVLSNKAVLTAKADIWDVAGSLVYPTGAETLEIITTGNDTVAGTGAQEVTIEYLDTSYATQTATAATNAGTQAITTVNFFRLQRMIVSAVGTGGANENNIDIQVTGGGNIRGRMLAGNNRTFASFFTVPAGKIAIPALLYADSKKNDDADLTFVSTVGTGGIFYPIFLASVYQNTVALPADVAAQIDEKSDIKVFGSSQVSSKVSASVQFILIDKAMVNLA